jgi:predicted nucleotidyltransferase
VPPRTLAAADLDRAVAEAAAREPAVLAAYVFGSRARDEACDRSDLDVAVLETPGVSLSLEAEDRLRRAIAHATGLPVDLARLGPASPVLAFEVLQGGRRVYARDAEQVDEQEERLLRRYLDTEHLRRVQREYLLGAEE